MEISLCMIVRDEARNLPRCLKSVLNAIDELIIVDTGGSEQARAAADRFGAHFFEYKWMDDYSSARNFAFEQATKSHLMWLDPDDVLGQGGLYELKRLKRSLDKRYSAVYMRYATQFQESKTPEKIVYKERLFSRAAGPKFVGAANEAIKYKGEAFYSEVLIERRPYGGDHLSMQNIRIYEKQLSSGAELSSRDQFFYGKELNENMRLKEAESALEAITKDPSCENAIRAEACLELASCLNKMGEPEKERKALELSMAIAMPRAEALCMLGNWWMAKGKYPMAIEYFKAAAAKEPGEAERAGAIVSIGSYGYIPYLRLSACSEKLGDYKAASQYNEQAGKIRPKSAEYRKNRKRLRRLSRKKMHLFWHR